jgi:hypothetical protein
MRDRGLHAFLGPLGLFLYRWGIEGHLPFQPLAKEIPVSPP